MSHIASGAEPNSAVPLLAIEDLHLSFRKPLGLVDRLRGMPRRDVHALNGISLTLDAGETIGIVGESGCGKSTLARAIVGLNRPDRGRILFKGRDVSGLKGDERRAFNRQVQMVFQDPYTSLNPRMRVEDMLGEALRVHRMRPDQEIPKRIHALLDLVRLPRDAALKYPHEFSGGQRQRISIARALAVEPSCIVADELVSALDVSVQAQVVNLLLELQRELRLAILFVAHDLRLVRHISHQVAVIYLGSIVESGPAEAIFARQQHPYSRALIEAAPSLDPDARRAAPAIKGELPSPMAIPPGCPFHVRCQSALARCTSEKPDLVPSGGGAVACHRAGEPGW